MIDVASDCETDARLCVGGEEGDGMWHQVEVSDCQISTEMGAPVLVASDAQKWNTPNMAPISDVISRYSPSEGRGGRVCVSRSSH